MITILFFFAGCLFNRIRGGLLDIIIFPKTNKLPSLVGKILNALAFGALIGFLLHNLYAIPFAAIGMFVGALPAWGVWVGGIVNRINLLKNTLLLSARGLLWSVCIAASLYYFNHAALYTAFIGLLMPAAYHLSRSLVSDPPKAWAFGEYIWGGIFWGLITFILTA